MKDNVDLLDHTKIDETFVDWDQILLKTGKHYTKKSLENTRLILEKFPKLKGVIGYDEFSDRVTIRKSIPEWHLSKGVLDSKAEKNIRTYIEKDEGLGHYLIPKEAFRDGVVPAAMDNSYNPIKEWIESKQWDGKKRAEDYFVDNLGAKCGDDSEKHYVHQVTRLMLLGAVSRVYYPGIKFDYVVILQGKQGIGKTAAVNKLCPDDKFFTSSLKSMGKDKEDSIDLQGYWLVELGELSALSASSLRDTKNFITIKYDNYRDPYATDNTPHPRKCIFVGTTNQDSYLRDKTGERRFLPVNCLGNDGKLFKQPKEYFQQVMAEAKSWLDTIISGCIGDSAQRNAVETSLLLDDSAKTVADQKRNAAKVEDLEEDSIKDFLNLKIPGNWKEFSIQEKRDYFQHRDDGLYWSKVEGLLNGQTEFHQLHEFTTKEALFIIFNVRLSRTMSKSDRAAQSKLNSSVQATGKWEKNGHVGRTKKYSGTRGYVKK